MPVTVYIALGTNLGDRLANLEAARRALEPEAHVVAASKIYETPPWGITDQPPFLNQVVRAETHLDPRPLLVLLKSLESGLGRTPGLRYGPRVIDLDILIYDDLVIKEPGLTVPHPRMAERAFVLVPLADLAPNLRHPIFNVSIATLLQNVDYAGIREYVG